MPILISIHRSTTPTVIVKLKHEATIAAAPSPGIGLHHVSGSKIIVVALDNSDESYRALFWVLDNLVKCWYDSKLVCIE